MLTAGNVRARRASGPRAQNSAKTQLTLLCSWAVELMLAHLDRAATHLGAARARAALRARGDGGGETDASTAEVVSAHELHASAARELSAFLTEHLPSLDVATTQELLATHGALEHLAHFASLTGDHDWRIQNLLHAGDVRGALGALAQLRAAAHAPLHYRHAHALLRAAPDETVQLWTGVDLSLIHI